MPTELWADGACSTELRAGGWAAILTAGRARRELAGGVPDTTNNRMEMTAVIEGLRVMKDGSAVSVHVDSTYVLDSVTKGWLEGWKRRGWRTASKQPVKNQDLWVQLDEQLGRLDVTWVKVKGHNGIELNERADRLAVRGRDAAKSGSTWSHDERFLLEE